MSRFVSSRGVLSNRSYSCCFIKMFLSRSLTGERLLGSLVTHALINSSISVETDIHCYSRKSKVSVLLLSSDPPVISRYSITPMLQTSLSSETLLSCRYSSGAKKSLSIPVTYIGLSWCCSLIKDSTPISLILSFILVYGLKPS